MRSELTVLRGLWEKASSEGSKARLLAGFSEETRLALYRLNGDAALVEGLAEPSIGSGIRELEQSPPITGPLELIQVGKLEVKSFEQRVEKVRLRAAERELAARYGLTFATLTKQERRQVVGMLAGWRSLTLPQ